MKPLKGLFFLSLSLFELLLRAPLILTPHLPREPQPGPCRGHGPHYGGGGLDENLPRVWGSPKESQGLAIEVDLVPLFSSLSFWLLDGMDESC